MEPNSCGTCKHFERVQQYRWGLCIAPAPWFVYGEGFAVDFKVWESTAEDCATYSEKETK